MAARAVPKKYEPDAMERAVLERWRADGTFGTQVAAGRKAYDESGQSDAHRFVFLEGPPTANGLPHPGHVLTRTLKDAVCRFHAMQAKWVPRKAGWDCHGLPVEIEVQKELGIEHVAGIETYGVPEFLAKCKESVFRYKVEWEQMSERVGFWLDYSDPYVTMEDRYIESVWWSLKRLFDQGLLVKSYKVVPYCPQTGTTYSSHEVAQGYKDVVDTSVYVKFHLATKLRHGKAHAMDKHLVGARVLSWTTTPWTLPGNVALAVGADVDYVVVRVTEAGEHATAAVGEVLVIAKRLQKAALRNHVEVIAECKGRDLVGLRYEPLFPGAIDPHNTVPQPWQVSAETTWTIAAADFVTVEDGTGVVHTAVMYGEDDFELGRTLGLPAKHTVLIDGNFHDGEKQGLRKAGLEGMYVKAPETERKILAWLTKHDTLYRSEPYEHSYPHCWRTGAPLLYYAMESWFVRMSTLRDALLANNDAINWVPETIKEGRMGDWLRNVKDWAFSRSRYWGTPLPVWTCTATDCGGMWCAGSRAELIAKARRDWDVPDDKMAELDARLPELHRPHVDLFNDLTCPKCGNASLSREPYVIDVWYDSGAAQFAQWQTASLDDEELREHHPVDFIAEGLDQTRGWFYSLLASATALGSSPEARKKKVFQGPPYRNCVVNGLILAEDGTKMSKSKKNYVPPDEVFAHVGADATRWYLLSATAPWQDKRFYEDAVRDTFGKFFSTLWNTFLFWHQYAALDEWRPSLKALDNVQKTTSPLDRWLLSRIEATAAEVLAQGDRYHLHKACRAIEDFVVGDLSNWWVRRSRDRFWQEKGTPDKWSAHTTLWWALHSVARMVAPFAPFMVEHIWEHVRLPEDPSSVHLAPLPVAGERDEGLEAQMATVRRFAEAGRALRSKIGVPVRHPLETSVIVAPEDHWIHRLYLEGAEANFNGKDEPPLLTLLKHELNTKTIQSTSNAAVVRSYVAHPNRAALGPAFKKDAPKVALAIEALHGDETHAKLADGRPVRVSVEGKEVTLTSEHVTFDQRDREGWASVEVDDSVLAFYVVRTPELLDEAFAREVIRRVQDLRKELDLDIAAEIGLRLAGAERLSGFVELVQKECRCSAVELVAAVQRPTKVWSIDGESVVCHVEAAGLQHGAVKAA